jgi:8-amino-7-oxononanoate synthase
MTHKFQEILQNRIEKGSERSLLSFEGKVDFWSNDYLGLGRNESLVSLKSGSGSRLISGNSKHIEAVESFLAKHFDAEAALVFNSGYDANLGFFSSVPQKGDTIIYDELIHASVRDGIRLSFAKSFSFKHNSVEDLGSKLSRSQGTIFVAVESLYSMDGDRAPLKEIVELCEEFGALLVVDEAHAGGVFGKNGTGLCVQENIKTFARLFTFGKGFGAHGSVLVGSNELRTFLINFARSFIYTTALPEQFYEHIQQQVVLASEEYLRIQLQKNIDLFRIHIPNLKSDKRSPIQIMEFDSLENCKATANLLQENNFAVKAILPPTVPEGKQCLRFCIHAFNTEEEILSLSKSLQNS